jgi:dihydrofolate synthase/folylpolyglutamate synthase
MRMTYKQTLDYLFSALPMYQRVGDVAIKKDLNNIIALCDVMGQPQDSFASIHVAGTNGKGSTAHMLAAVFQAAGKKVGLYTSPHYVDFRERIKVNGEEISTQAVVRFVEKNKEHWDAIRPSFFEITVAMAFDYFRKEKVDIAIIETGLGGRLDSTNIIHPKMSVITNIGYDHMQMLGNTLPEIAFEKAGIIKPGIPVIIGEWKKETAAVFKAKAAREKAPIYFASRHLHLALKKSSGLNQKFSVATRTETWFSDLTIDLLARYQKFNLATVLESIWQWNRYYPEERVGDRAIRTGLKNVKSLTKMKGRWMVLHRHPLVITDAAHNLEGLRGVLPELLKQPAQRRHFVLGFVSDKEISKILGLFPKGGVYYWTRADIPRAKAVADLQEEGMAQGLKGERYENVRKAFVAAMRSAGPSDLVFVGGSSYVVGDFLKLRPEHII